MKNTYKITLSGCDDATIVVTELSAEEALTIKKLKAMVNKTSTYGCQPTMTIEERNQKAEEEN